MMERTSKTSIWYAAVPALAATVIAALLMSGRAVLAGAASGGAVGYVAGSEAGEEEAREKIEAREQR